MVVQAPNWSKFLQLCTHEEAMLLQALKGHKKLPLSEQRAFNAALGRCT